MKPKAKPKLSREQLLERIKEYDISEYPLVIVGIRGYYLNSMGAPGKNDRGIYDDALFILTDQHFSAWNGNTDPSKFRDGIAVLAPGFWPCYRFDNHRGKTSYPAICQRVANVVVNRDNGKKNHSGMFGINIHNGGWGTTGSLGCQTTPPDQWDDFYLSAKSEAVRIWGDRWDKETVLYILIEE